MALALAEARRAAEAGEVPVGAVTVVDGVVVAARHNEREAQPRPDRPRRAAGPARDSGPAGDLAPGRGHPGGDARTLPDVRRCPGGGPGRPPRLRGRRPPGRSLRHPLQPLCRPPAQPRAAGHRRCVARQECSALLTSFFAGKRGEQHGLPQPPELARATSLSSGGVRERPNRTVSKTVVPHGHRGFKSHLLRSGPRRPSH